jgi:hypothetical protein
MTFVGENSRNFQEFRKTRRKMDLRLRVRSTPDRLAVHARMPFLEIAEERHATRLSSSKSSVYGRELNWPQKDTKDAKKNCEVAMYCEFLKVSSLLRLPQFRRAVGGRQ